MDRDAAKIIDNLLTFISWKEVMSFNIHLDKAQELLQKHEWIVDALLFLQKAEKEGSDIKWVHSEWIDKLPLNMAVKNE